jgi:PTH1 family peptidyl-tRNA hydrolase
VKVVVGLGNPGQRYEKTRHNVGWMVLDRIADRAGIGGRVKARDAAAVVIGRIDGLDLVLAKPTTYMNLSGVAVRKLLARERAPKADMLVIVDDFALPLGRLRMRGEGSAGGHNGLRSIIAELGTQDFARLRVGIGEPGRSSVDYVLSRFAPEEQMTVDEVIDAAADAVLAWAREGLDRTANRWNAWTPAPPATEAREEGARGAPASSREASAIPATPEGPAPGEVGGPADAHGVRRTSTGWRRLLGGAWSDRTAPRGAGPERDRR